MKYYDIYKIKNFMKKNNLTEKDFCKICGINLKTYQHILNQNPKLNLKSVIKIIKVLKESIFLF